MKTVLASFRERSRSWVVHIVAILKTKPFTLSYVAILIFASTAWLLLRPFNSFFQDVTPERFAVHEWWSIARTLVTTHSFASLVFMVILAICVLSFAEKLMGSLRTMIAFLATSTVGILVGVGVQVVGQVNGQSWARMTYRMATHDPSIALLGVLMTASAWARPFWRRQIRITSLVVGLTFVLYSGHPADVYRFIAIFAGLGLGILLAPTSTKANWERSVHYNHRAASSAIVALTAAGIGVGLLSSNRYGLFSSLPMMFEILTGHPVPPCPKTGTLSDCVSTLALDHTGYVIFAITPLMLLFLTAYGLLRGRRFALWVAVVVNTFLSITTLVYALSLPKRMEAETFSLIVCIAAPIAMSVWLIISRKHFAIMPSRSLLLPYSIALSLPIFAFVVFFITTSIETSLLLEIFIQILWIIALIGAIPAMRSVGHGKDQKKYERARKLVQQGGENLAFMTTWEGNSYWFDFKETSAIAYRVIGNIAITTGAPIGKNIYHKTTIQEFARFCDDHGLIPVFYSLSSKYQSIFDSLGWSTLVVAQEAILSPQTWDTKGKKWQDVRTSLNKAQRLGMTSKWCAYDELSDREKNAILDISQQWVDDKKLPEMGFTLGSVKELKDPQVRLMLALDQDDVVQGITSWLPQFENGQVIGWTLDFMRRNHHTFNGVMEFLIAQSALYMKENGYTVMSLSASPLANIDSTKGTIGQVLRFVTASLEPVYGFSSLFAFKQKFQPQEVEMIMAYPAPAVLPSIGVALGKAYLPGLSVKHVKTLMQAHR